MAKSAVERVGASKRSFIKRRKKANITTGILDTTATVSSLIGGQAKKAGTAWGEYEAGYEALGGDVKDIKKPGFFKKTAQQFLPGGKTGLPEGEVTIGEKIYDRKKIRQAGALLGTDTAALFFSGKEGERRRTEYLERTTPGRWDPSQFDKPAQGPSPAWSAPKKPTVPFKEDAYDVDEEFGTLISDRPVYQPAPPKSMKPMTLQGQEPGLATVGKDWVTPLQYGKDEPLQETEAGGYGVDPKPRGRQFGQWFRDFIRDYGTFGKGLAKDNPGGRERVTVTPLDSDDTKGHYGKAHNWLEALYENNRRRKNY